jgi:hypothetical protein
MVGLLGDYAFQGFKREDESRGAGRVAEKAAHLLREMSSQPSGVGHVEEGSLVAGEHKDPRDGETGL